MKKTKALLAGAAAALAVLAAGCSAIPGMGGSDTNEAHVGDTVSTSWFDYTVTSAEPMDTYEGYTAAEGNKLVGIISHVSALKARIDRQIVIRKTRGGSSTVEVVC